METVLELRNVNKIYQTGEVKLHVLKNINLKINRGEGIALIGASGSGKSTLLNIIGCLDRPTEGKIFIDGKDTSKLDDNALAQIRGKKIGFVFQSFNLIPNLTALENVELPLMFFNIPNRKERAEEMLKSVGLSHRIHHYPSQMSGGEQQRVAIARALVNEPDVILADEPTGNLDSKAGEEIMKLLNNLNKQGITFILVSHDKYLTKTIKRKVYLKDGEIIKGE